MMQALDNNTWVTGVIIITFVLIMVIVKTSQNHNQWKSMRSGKVIPLPRPNLGKCKVIPLPRPNLGKQNLSTRPNLRVRGTSPIKEVQLSNTFATSAQQPTARPPLPPTTRPPLPPKSNLGGKTSSVSNLSDFVNDRVDHCTTSHSFPIMSVSAPINSYTCQRCSNSVNMRYTNCSMHKNDKLVCSECFKAEWK